MRGSGCAGAFSSLPLALEVHEELREVVVNPAAELNAALDIGNGHRCHAEPLGHGTLTHAERSAPLSKFTARVLRHLLNLPNASFTILIDIHIKTLSEMARKQRTIQLAAHDREAIEAAVAFANCKVESVEQVEKIFRQAALPRDIWQTIPAESVRDFKDHDQHELRDWLSQIVAKGHVVPEVRKKIAERIKTVGVLTEGFVFEGGRLHLTYAPSFSGVQACYSYAVARLVSADSDRLAKRLGLCPRCGKFFFKDRRKRFCSDAHRNRFYVMFNTHPEKRGRWRPPPLP